MGATAARRAVLALAALLFVAGTISALASRSFGITHAARTTSAGTVPTSTVPTSTVPAVSTTTTSVAPAAGGAASVGGASSSSSTTVAASTTAAAAASLAATGSATELPITAVGLTLVLLGYCVVRIEASNEELMAPLFYQPKHSRRRRRS